MNLELSDNREALKEALPSKDVLSFFFETKDGTKAEIFYIDGIVNKELLGTLVITPLKETNEIAFPEVKKAQTIEECVSALLEGNPVLLLDKRGALIVGTKSVPMRSVSEPQSGLVLKGPRAGFIEEVKTNMAQIRLRLKTPSLRFESLTVGKQSATLVTIAYLDGIAPKQVVEKVKRKIKSISIDCIPDSSYIQKFLLPKRPSLFKEVNTTEKPDIFCARIAEGRVGILVDGSPVALTVPYLLVEDFQSPEDYYVSPYRATFVRFLRLFVLLLAIFLPALYVAAQLFKMQLIPLHLLLTIASSIQGLPLSPSLEVFVTLMLLEVLNEASIRMPKYVALALSVVGALVLGETAVNAGILSTPAVILIAFSGISLYTVPDLIETTSMLRLFYLIMAGSIGIYGIVLFTLFLVIYLVGEEPFGVPILAPFSPLVRGDLKDSLLKCSLSSLKKRPISLKSPNRRRQK